MLCLSKDFFFQKLQNSHNYFQCNITAFGPSGFWGLIHICILDAIEEDNSLLGWIQDLDADDSHNVVHNLASAASGSCSASQRS